MSPKPTTPRVRPRSSSTSYGAQRASALAASMRGRSLAKNAAAKSAHSAREDEYTPRALVSTTSRAAASAGHSRWFTPALAVCTPRSCGSCGSSSASASRPAALAPCGPGARA